MAETKPDKCEFPDYNCPAAKGSKYCSPSCESVPINHLSLACGHADCAAGQTVGAGDRVGSQIRRHFRRTVPYSRAASGGDYAAGDRRPSHPIRDSAWPNPADGVAVEVVQGPLMA